MVIFSYLFFLILMIGPLIFFHELGHFLFAKLFGVKVTRFSLGFGPPIPGLRRTWGETEYQVAAVPLGGYVKMVGEDPTEELSEEEKARAFNHAALWKRYLIVAAGPAFNVLLAVIIFFFGNLYLRDEGHLAVVGSVMPNTPAAEAGLQPGDRLVQVQDTPIKYWRDMRHIVEDRPEQPTRFVVRRDGKRLEFTIRPALFKVLTKLLNVEERKGIIGISLAAPKPQIGVWDRDRPAWRAGLRTGDLVTHVNGQAVDTWRELRQALQRAVRAPTQKLHLVVLRQTAPVGGYADLREYVPSEIALSLRGKAAAEQGLRAYGIESADMFLDYVAPDTPAQKLGLRPNDRILKLDDHRIDSWFLLEQRLREKPGKAHRLTWRTPDGKVHEKRFKLKEVRETDEFKQERVRYVFGARNRLAYATPEPVPFTFGERLRYAFFDSFTQTWELSRIMVLGIAQMIRGHVPTSSIGGPIMLAHVARTTANKGWEMFVFTLALISINLALINLLPIPILDGGHIVVFTVEAIRRKPLSLNARATMNLVGLVLIIILMLLAFKNDCVRYILN
jgi:regulator of sigma E protease